MADPNNALRGDVIAFQLYIATALYIPYTSANTESLRARLNNSGYRVLALNDAAAGTLLGGGTLIGTVQIENDGHGHVVDVASVVRGAAIAAGYRVSSAEAYHLSRARDGQTYNPNNDPSRKGDDFLSKILDTATSPLVIGLIALVIIGRVITND